MKKTYLATFVDPDDADRFLTAKAKELKRMRLTPRFTVGIETQYGNHEVYLYEEKSDGK